MQTGNTVMLSRAEIARSGHASRAIAKLRPADAACVSRAAAPRNCAAIRNVITSNPASAIAVTGYDTPQLSQTIHSSRNGIVRVYADRRVAVSWRQNLCSPEQEPPDEGYQRDRSGPEKGRDRVADRLPGQSDHRGRGRGRYPHDHGAP